MRHRHAERCIGLISDTHGLVRPEALDVLRGADRIIHAGDIGDPAVLDALAALAPLTAVKGNNDTGPWARALPLTASVEEGGVLLYVIHEIAHLKSHPSPTDAAVVISGHSHRPSVASRDEVLWVNPGSAGRRRFKLPVSVATLTIRAGRVTAKIHELQVASAAGSR